MKGRPSRKPTRQLKTETGRSKRFQTPLLAAVSQRGVARYSLVSLVLLLARVLKRSESGARIPSIVPNMVLRPRLSSMRKKSADQKGLPGRSDMASVKAMKAKPVPSAP